MGSCVGRNGLCWLVVALVSCQSPTPPPPEPEGNVAAPPSRAERGAAEPEPAIVSAADTLSASAVAGADATEVAALPVAAAPAAPSPAAPSPAAPHNVQLAPEPLRGSQSGAISARERALFWGSQQDPPPDARARIAHYWAGNEGTLSVFEPVLRGLGGGFAGVGTDQAYLFIGWQRPSFAWLFDYDPMVQCVHQIHQVFFGVAPDPEAFIALWRRPREGRAVLVEALRDVPERDLLLEVFDKSQKLVGRRLDKVRKEMKRSATTSYLTDADEYRYVVRFVQEGRARPMLGNLLSEQALRGIGEVARTLDVPVRALYLSNAEQFFDYTDAFKENIRALPYDDRSLIVRTMAFGEGSDDYVYIIQSAENFLGWLAESWVRGVNQLKRREEKRGAITFAEVTRTAAEHRERRLK